jgi:hypothetical protein
MEVEKIRKERKEKREEKERLEKILSTEVRWGEVAQELGRSVGFTPTSAGRGSAGWRGQFTTTISSSTSLTVIVSGTVGSGN